MISTNLSWPGSFQAENKFSCENPLEEVWAQIQRIGLRSWLAKAVPEKKDIPWEEYLKYVEVRIQQSIEFRQAVQKLTLLTAPLPLYYSFLNLTRALMALVPEVMPRPSHGLHFVRGDHLLNTGAKIARGTFSDYLDCAGVKWNIDDQITLGEALGFIVEIDHDFRQFYPELSSVQNVLINACMNGEVRLNFLHYPGDFENCWDEDFPQLADVCTLVDKNSLVVTDPELGKDYGAVGKFANKHLLPSLMLQTRPAWHTFRESRRILKLNRSSYYYVAIFILASVVRYTPELILGESGEHSQLGWTLRRFMSFAERFFPQLKLMEVHQSELYFSGSAGML